MKGAITEFKMKRMEYTKYWVGHMQCTNNTNSKFACHVGCDWFTDVQIMRFYINVTFSVHVWEIWRQKERKTPHRTNRGKLPKPCYVSNKQSSPHAHTVLVYLLYVSVVCKQTEARYFSHAGLEKEEVVWLLLFLFMYLSGLQHSRTYESCLPNNSQQSCPSG